MLIKTLLNRCHPTKGFVYGAVSWIEMGGTAALKVAVAARRTSRTVCAGCGRAGRTYDHLEARRFEFIPLWGYHVFLEYRMRLVECAECGVHVERVPFGDGKHQLTPAYRSYLARWANRLSWQETAVAWVVEYGLAHRELGAIEAIGVDEVAWQQGHHYLTVVYQLDAGRRRPAVGGPRSHGQDPPAFLSLVR